MENEGKTPIDVASFQNQVENCYTQHPLATGAGQLTMTVLDLYGTNEAAKEISMARAGARTTRTSLNQSGELLDDGIRSGRQTVNDIIKGVENGDIPLTNNIQKGNYGEMKMDVYFESQGYERISLDKVTDLDAPTHQGIDGVYYNSDGYPPYVIGEAKYGSSGLGNTRDGMQMSDTWINGSDRLVNAVGKEVADDILLEGYERTIVNIAPDGTINITNLD